MSKPSTISLNRNQYYDAEVSHVICDHVVAPSQRLVVTLIPSNRYTDCTHLVSLAIMFVSSGTIILAFYYSCPFARRTEFERYELKCGMCNRKKSF